MRKSNIDVNACLQYVNKLFSTDKKFKKVYKLSKIYSESVEFTSDVFDIVFNLHIEPEMEFNFIIYLDNSDIYTNEQLQDNVPDSNCFEQDFEIFVQESLETLERFTLAYKQIKKHQEAIYAITDYDEELDIMYSIMKDK